MVGEKEKKRGDDSDKKIKEIVGYGEEMDKGLRKGQDEVAIYSFLKIGRPPIFPTKCLMHSVVGPACVKIGGWKEMNGQLVKPGSKK